VLRSGSIGRLSNVPFQQHRASVFASNVGVGLLVDVVTTSRDVEEDDDDAVPTDKYRHSRSRAGRYMDRLTLVDDRCEPPSSGLASPI
jgi:hypothetical protein